MGLSACGYNPEMATSLAELHRQVDALEAQIPAWLEAHPDAGDFWPAFAGVADLIEDHAEHHSAEICARIHELADRARDQLQSAE